MTIKQQAPPFLSGSDERLSGAVPLHSRFYIPRPVIEAKAFAEISRPGGLLRLKAPQKIGKSTLMLRLFHQALDLNYQPLHLDLQLAEHALLSDPERFLRWFCAHISRRLGLEPKFDQYWQKQTSSQHSCMQYLQDYLLKQFDRPVLILCNEITRLSEYPAAAHEFLALVRSLHEAAQQNHLFTKLRLVLAYSAEMHLPLKLHPSPFNLGTAIELPRFTLSEIQTLAARYGFDWTDATGTQQALTLQDFVGGHPYLVQLTLHHLASRTPFRPQTIEALNQLIETATTATGIYSDHLQHHLFVLDAHPELAAAFNQVLTAKAHTIIPPVQAHQLYSLGLVMLRGDRIAISCSLYQRYFNQHRLPDPVIKLSTAS